ncbi:carbohydrate ABC transporter substrate-binding protein, CUT1 family [Alkalispirochaeta americana]|uniref:Carbohydrate ABC transporter substrate-binding protein, CUT1 family n=1 Tax=Alkalispirochaeta americana TaxID=159291 RepID=A0A1N6PUZ2_9SPIO|nr:sugar ABC transporter substrate-binding protein [Alkalispirochaeta americana]SIQ08096.1 carbohydrate ABC transporter substrate-binding protein, CUT1 family [Alkalispirochaeta americana]
MAKKLFCMVAVAVVGFGFPAFSGGRAEAPAPAEKPEKLTIIALDIDVVQFGPAAQVFEDTYGIEVEWLEFPYGQLWSQITTGITAGTPIDLYMMSNSWHAELGGVGMAIPLNDLATDAELDAMTEKYFDITREFLTSHDGKLWGLPSTAASVSFFYNAAMLKELGYNEPPATFDEMLQISREAIDQGLASYGFFPGWIAGGECGMVQFDIMLKLFGGEWMNEDRTEFTFNSEAGINALTYMKEILDEGIVPRAALETSDWDNFHFFLAGDQPFEINWNFIWGRATDPEQSSIVNDVAVAPIPSIVREAYTVLGGGGYAISPTSRSPEWAFKLLQYMKGEEGARGVMRQQGGAEGTIKALYQPPLVNEFPPEEYPLVETFQRQIQEAGLRPSHFLTWYSEFRNNIFTPAMHLALLGDRSPEEALNQAQAAAQRMLDREGL